MTEKENALVSMYLSYKKDEEKARKGYNDTLKELAGLAPHKVGDVIKWVEYRKKRVGGTFYNPIYQDLPPIVRKAVVICVHASVWQWKDKEPDLKYNYDFIPIKKDGGVSQNQCYPSNYEWTDEVYDLNKE